MRYKISGNELRTENAAKPHTQQSAPVVSYFQKKDKVNNLLDFGCGKLRYSDVLTSISNKTTFVDSEIQLTRKQVVRGTKTSVKEYIARNYKGCRSIPLEEVHKHSNEYELITCTNVLSAIPCKETLISSLHQIKRLLKAEGIVVFINQHKSSYFKKYETGQKHMYGYLYQGRKGTTYYGILCKDTMHTLLTENGFSILESFTKGDRNYIEATVKSS
jgi:2-polyprenyl-3-methyl-5-hydroxy-6-metoxy-1,4-benzoquinol methylase